MGSRPANRAVAWITIPAGLLLLAYSGWALYSGWVISTWLQMQPRGTPIYWITVGAFALLGAANLILGIRLLHR